MHPSSMLRKRLRVFENISQDDEIKENFKQSLSDLRKVSALEEENQEDDLPDMDFEFNSDSNFSLVSQKKETNEIRGKVFEKEEDPWPVYSNTLLLDLPSKMICEEDICSFLTFYGEIEFINVSVSSSSNKSKILVKFYDLRAAKKAFNEISYNFDKLLNIFEKEKFSVIFEKNRAEIFEKFYMALQFSINSQEILKVLQFIEIHAEIEKVFSLEDERNSYNNNNNFFMDFHQQHVFAVFPKRIMIKFFNSKEMKVVDFLLKKITQTGNVSKLNFSTPQIKNLKVVLEKNEKIEEETILTSGSKSLSTSSEEADMISNLNLNLNFTKLILGENDRENSFTSKQNEHINLESKSNSKIIPSVPITPIALSSNANKNFLLDNSNCDSNVIKLPPTPKTTVNSKTNIYQKSLNSVRPEKTQKYSRGDKENCSSLANKKRSTYQIVYDQNYSGIKKRNTPDEERKKYVISIQNIINEKDLRTTLMIKNIPNFTTQVELLKIINKNYSAAYNFFYLPIDFNKRLNAGYAFINFRSAKLIVNFFLEFEGKPWDLANSNNKLCYLSYARIQGFRSICEHFQKSNIMKQVDDKVKPIIKIN